MQNNAWHTLNAHNVLAVITVIPYVFSYSVGCQKIWLELLYPISSQMLCHFQKETDLLKVAK